MADKQDTNARSVPASVVVPDHELVRLIGVGSYGEVWLARNTLGVYRAVKVVHEKTFRHKRPFEREFNGVQKFEPLSRRHEGLVNVLQVGRNQDAGYFYYIMELADDVVSGDVINPDTYRPRTLGCHISKSGRLPMSECMRIGATIAEALAFLHDRRLIHRDVKPSNIIFVEGIPKLADIGLVAEISEARSYVGTEGFIPPEGPGTVQSDIYSLGKVLYEISTGKDRYDYPELPTRLGDSIRDEEMLHLNVIVLKACRVDPARRYKSARVMAADLRDMAGGSRRSLKRITLQLLPKVAKVGVPAVALAIVAGILYARGTRKLVENDSNEGESRVRNSAAAIPPPPGLIAWWTADGNALDSVGRSDGTLMNGVSFASGKVGQAFRFDGVNDHIRIADGPQFRFTNSLSVEMWVYPTAMDASQVLLAKWDALKDLNQRSFAFSIHADGRVDFGVSSDGTDTGSASVYSTNSLSQLSTSW